MNPLDREENLDIPESEEPRTSDVMPNTEESAGSTLNIPTSRRSFVIALSALALTAGMPSEVKADTTSDSNKELLRERFAGKPHHPEQLAETEIQMMDRGMNAVFRHYLQPSFFASAIPGGQKEEDEVRATLKEAVLNYDKLHYQRDANGDIVIKKRRLYRGAHSFSSLRQIVIGSDGVIKKVNNHNITGIGDWKKEWKEVQSRIEAINPRIVSSGLVKQDWKWFESYSLRLPRQLREVLDLKRRAFGNLSAKETEVLNILNKQLKGHPQTAKEMLGGKIAKFYATRRPSHAPKPTPAGMIELVYPATYSVRNKRFQTFAIFDFDGFVMQSDRKGGYKKSSSPFAELYCRKIRKTPKEAMPQLAGQLEKQCKQGIRQPGSVQRKTNDATACSQSSNPSQCEQELRQNRAGRYYLRQLGKCFRDKLHEWLSQARYR